MFTRDEIDALSNLEYPLTFYEIKDASWNVLLTFSHNNYPICLEIKDMRTQGSSIFFIWHYVTLYTDKTRLDMTKKMKKLENIIKDRDKERLKMMYHDHYFSYDSMFVQKIEQYEHRKTNYESTSMKKLIDNMQFCIQIMLPPQIYLPGHVNVKEARIIGEDAHLFVQDLNVLGWGTFEFTPPNTYLFIPKTNWHAWQYDYFLKEVKKIGYSVVLLT